MTTPSVESAGRPFIAPHRIAGSVRDTNAAYLKDEAFVPDDSYAVDVFEWLDRPKARIGFHPPVPRWFKIYIAVAFVASVFLVVTM